MGFSSTSQWEWLKMCIISRLLPTFILNLAGNMVSCTLRDWTSRTYCAGAHSPCGTLIHDDHWEMFDVYAMNSMMIDWTYAFTCQVPRLFDSSDEFARYTVNMKPCSIFLNRNVWHSAFDLSKLCLWHFLCYWIVASVILYDKLSSSPLIL